jgi:hypothetical protein
MSSADVFKWALFASQVFAVFGAYVVGTPFEEHGISAYFAHVSHEAADAFEPQHHVAAFAFFGFAE